MEAIEARLLDFYPLSSEAWTHLHPRGLLSGFNPGTTFTKFSSNPDVFIVRQDNGHPGYIVNVFDNEGNHKYSIERRSLYSTLWTIYNADSREQIAKIKCGLLNRTVAFLNKPGIHIREIGKPRLLYGGLPDRTFYLNDGAPYQWKHSSQYLERVINPGGGHEEVRQRLARVRLLRSFRPEWELLVDPEFDSEIALATAFISMLTQWSTIRTVSPGVRSA